MTAQRELNSVYRPGKRAKKVLQPRSARHLGHPHELANGKDLHRHEMPDSGATRTPRASKMTKSHSEMVERNLEIIAEATPEAVRGEVEIFKEKLAEGEAQGVPEGRRAAYAALETHREMASTVLAAGGTYDEAADWAGVSASTVSGWYAEPEFRKRVDEQRAIVKAKIGGRIEAWMDRRTADPNKLDEADPKTTLAIYDRIASRPGVAAAADNKQPINVNILTYSDLMERAARAAAGRSTEAEVDVVDAGGQGSGFPLIGPGGVSVASGGTQQD